MLYRITNSRYIALTFLSAYHIFVRSRSGADSSAPVETVDATAYKVHGTAEIDAIRDRHVAPLLYLKNPG